MHNEAQIAQRALRAGANGYLTKDHNPETLLAAIHRVASGGRYHPRIAEQLAFASSSPRTMPPPSSPIASSRSSDCWPRA